MQKRVLITGAGRGIGAETASNLYKLGYHVIIACRNTEQAETIKQSCLASTNGDSTGLIDIMPLDLSDLSSVRHLANEFYQRYDSLDVLINNAGTVSSTRKLSADGYEYVFAVNHLGHFLLTGLLLKALQESEQGRIINVASNAHLKAKLDLNDLMAEKHYSMYPVYCRSKLANVLFTYELTRRLAGSLITANCLHPGVINSTIWPQSNWFYRLFYQLIRPFMIDVKEGAFCSSYLASEEKLAQSSGGYFDPKAKLINSSKISYDERLAGELWNVSEKMVDFHWPF